MGLIDIVNDMTNDYRRCDARSEDTGYSAVERRIWAGKAATLQRYAIALRECLSSPLILISGTQLSTQAKQKRQI